MTKILIISDISWENKILKVKSSGLSYTDSKPYDSDYHLNSIIKIISKTNPDLILLAGDIIGDGSCRDIHVEKFIKLLEYFEIKKIPSMFIQGNHDVQCEYDKIIDLINKGSLKYTNEISGRTMNFNNILIHGLSYNHTHTIKSMRLINVSIPKDIDILLTHPDTSMRPALFDFKPIILICGHSGEHITKIKDTLFLSSSSFSNTLMNFKTSNNITINDKLYRITMKKGMFKFTRDNRENLYKNNTLIYKAMVEKVLKGKLSLKEIINFGIPTSWVAKYSSLQEKKLDKEQFILDNYL